MFELQRNNRILVVVAHPDDEVLGPGATVHRLSVEKRCTIRAVILGEGITSRGNVRQRNKWAKELKVHRDNIHRAGNTILYESIGVYDFPDNRFDTVPLLDIVKIIEKEKRDYEPELVFTHHCGDTNIDHRRTFDAVIAASRPMKGESVRTICSFEIPSSTEWQAFNYSGYFTPNVFSRVSRVDIDAKIKAMECYEYERREFPHPRSPESLEILARHRGVTVGTDYAEAFMLIRSIT